MSSLQVLPEKHEILCLIARGQKYFLGMRSICSQQTAMGTSPSFHCSSKYCEIRFQASTFSLHGHCPPSRNVSSSACGEVRMSWKVTFQMGAFPPPWAEAREGTGKTGSDRQQPWKNLWFQPWGIYRGMQEPCLNGHQWRKPSNKRWRGSFTEKGSRWP